MRECLVGMAAFTDNPGTDIGQCLKPSTHPSNMASHSCALQNRIPPHARTALKSKFTISKAMENWEQGLTGLVSKEDVPVTRGEV